MPELNINELKWIASFYSTRNLQKISESDYDQPGRLTGRDVTGGESVRGEREDKEDTIERICVKCRLFREHYRLPRNVHVYAETQVYTTRWMEKGQREEEDKRMCEKVLVEAVPLYV